MRLFGIPLRIHASWYVIVLVMVWLLSTAFFPARHPGLSVGLYWIMGGLSAPLLFVCVLLHELAHSVVARAYGIPVRQVTLFIFGGVAQIANEPRRPSIELQVTLAGPLVSALLAGVCFWLGPRIEMTHPVPLVAGAILRYLALVNAGLLLFNLLPGFPLDGGRLLRATLWAGTGSLRRATRIASGVGSALGLGLLLLGLWLAVTGRWIDGGWLMVLGVFLRDTAMASYRAARG